MKLQFSLLALVGLIFTSTKAAVFTVNNAPGNGAQFTQVNAAVAAASSGDTIYVSGSTVIYSDATLSKPITLIGPGAFNGTSFNLRAIFNNVYLTNNSSSSTISGIELNQGSIFMFGLNNISNIYIVNCYFPSQRLLLNGLQNSSNIYIRNNIFGGGNSSIEFGSNTGCFNIVIEHNIINGFINSLNILNTLIQNNVFYNSAPNGQPVAFFNPCSNLVIKNNIFFNSSPTTNTISCIYSNNITYSTSTTYTALGGTNIDNTNPLFINVPTSGNYNQLLDFHLQAVSLGIGAGSDGNEIGYYGGIVQVNPSGELWNMPYIRKMDVLNTNVAPNGNVNVKVRSTKAR